MFDLPCKTKDLISEEKLFIDDVKTHYYFNV